MPSRKVNDLISSFVLPINVWIILFIVWLKSFTACISESEGVTSRGNGGPSFLLTYSSRQDRMWCLFVVVKRLTRLSDEEWVCVLLARSQLTPGLESACVWSLHGFSLYLKFQSYWGPWKSLELWNVYWILFLFFETGVLYIALAVQNLLCSPGWI